MRPTYQRQLTKPIALQNFVCSNSFRSDDPERSAIGLLHEEMRNLNSLVMKCADQTRFLQVAHSRLIEMNFRNQSVKPFSIIPFQIKREEVSSLERKIGTIYNRDRPPDLSEFSDRDCKFRRYGVPGVFRRNRTDNSQRLYRFFNSLVSIQIRQRNRIRLRQLSND